MTEIRECRIEPLGLQADQIARLKHVMECGRYYCEIGQSRTDFDAHVMDPNGYTLSGFTGKDFRKVYQMARRLVRQEAKFQRDRA